MSLEDVTFLQPVEQISVDPAVIQSMPGLMAGGSLLTQTDDLFEDFIVCLSAIDSAWGAGEFDRLLSQSEMLVVLSETLGLGQCAKVAGHVRALLPGTDEVALAAVVARVLRVGEISLASVLEYAYRRI